MDLRQKDISCRGLPTSAVMFTAAEVGALITAGKFLNCHGDESFKVFDSAMYKIKSI